MISQHWVSASLFFFTWVGQGSAGSCLPAYTAKATVVGCFQDRDDLPDLTGPRFNFIGVDSPEYCANVCGVGGYSYSGLKGGIQCFCGNQIETSAIRATDDALCNSACSGDEKAKCGSNTMMNIYKIENPEKDHPSKPGVPDCGREPLCSNKICDKSLSMTDRATALVKSMNLEEKVGNIGSFANGSVRLGLPYYPWWNEALHGLATFPQHPHQSPLTGKYGSSTSFPLPILMSAAFDDKLIYDVAEVISIESRAFGNNGFAGLDFWTPNTNAFRDPRWGRGLETPGEDPHRIQGYTYNLVTAFEGKNKDFKRAHATCKHFAAYDVEGGREGNDLKPTAQDMAEYYLPMFKTCVRDAKVSSIMCAYNSVYGIPSCGSKYLLQDILRDHWKFNEPYNYVVSDCDAVKDFVEPHHYSASPAAAAADALNAGTDLNCGPTYNNNLGDAVKQKLTTEAQMDTSLIRLYSALIKVGYFDSVPEYSSLSWADVNTERAQKLARQAAIDGMTLLKNDGTLPLSKDIKKVAVIGPWANATTQMQANYHGIAPYLNSPISAFKKHWHDATLVEGTGINSQDTAGFADAIAAAKDADCILYLGGIDLTIEAEDKDRQDIAWPGNQLDLISKLSELKKPLVIVQFGGGQVDDAPLLENKNVNSILWAGYPGQDGGNAVLDVLIGTAQPAGRLPVTQYPASYIKDNSITDMNLRPASGIPGRTYMWYSGKPTLPFAHGLHYTEFSVTWGKAPEKKQYDIAALMSAAAAVDDKDLSPFETFSINVKNTGKLTSDYVGLLFLSTRNAGPAPYPVKQLVSYGRVRKIQAGKSKKLDLAVILGSLARADTNGDKYIYPGEYTLAVDIDGRVEHTFELTGKPAQLDTLPRNKDSKKSG